MNYTDAIDLLAQTRFSRLAAKYQVETDAGPVNAGMFRDNVMDILEELTDTINISGLLFERLTQDSDSFLVAVGGLQMLEAGVNNFIEACQYLDAHLPAQYRQEDVIREVSREEVGLCAE